MDELQRSLQMLQFHRYWLAACFSKDVGHIWSMLCDYVSLVGALCLRELPMGLHVLVTGQLDQVAFYHKLINLCGYFGSLVAVFLNIMKGVFPPF